MLKTPTVELVKDECRFYDEDPFNQLGDKALKELLGQFPQNTVASHVLLKVLVLDRLYHTRVREIDIEPLARHIAESKTKTEVDSMLAQESLDAVRRIWQCPELRRRYYSFATKFCSWHKPESYPIFDSFAVECLWAYKKRDHFAEFHRQDLCFYEKFVATVAAFREHYALDCLTFRQIDKFLWRSGDRIIRSMKQKESESEIVGDSLSHTAN